MSKRVGRRGLVLVVGALGVGFAAGFSSASMPCSHGKVRAHSLIHRSARPLLHQKAPEGRARTRIVRIAAPKIANHQSWSQISRHFDTKKIEEARQVLNGVCYMWESSLRADRRWRIIACWQDAP